MDDYKVTVQLRSSKSEPDETALEQLLLKRGLWLDACKMVVDHDAVEQLYLNDKLTDSDLRSIGAETKVVVALQVEKNV